MEQNQECEACDFNDEEMCEHIEHGFTRQLEVENPYNWYCTTCAKEFESIRETEAHSIDNPDHCCFYQVHKDVVLCSKCKKMMFHFLESLNSMSSESSRNSSDSEGDSLDNLEEDDSDRERLPFVSYSYYDGKRIELKDLCNGLKQDKFKNIVVIAGAGISCASGIPDFRSANGLYRNLGKYPVPYLTDPSSIFNLRGFYHYPIPFWILAREMFYTSNKYHPTPCHFFLKMLSSKGILRRVYTQNIDGLERLAGLKPPQLVEGHGTCMRCSCQSCQCEFDSAILQESVDQHHVPHCPRCGGLIKV